MQRFKRTTFVCYLLFCTLLLLFISQRLGDNSSFYNVLEVSTNKTNSQNQIQENVKEEVTAFVAILSYILFKDRRDGIRDSWGAICRESKIAVCKFIIDGLDNTGQPIAESQKHKVINESMKYYDVVLMDSYAGGNFLYRFFRTLLWVLKRYNFQFFVRIDDDQYLCFERLMYELPQRRKERNLLWGYQNCQLDHRVNPALWILSEDLIQYFMARKDTLICTPFEDLGIRMWMDELWEQKNVTLFSDFRMYHHMKVSALPQLSYRKEICHKYISFHGAYVKEMGLLHKIWLKEKQSKLPPYEITPIINKCKLDPKNYEHNSISPLCIERPILTKSKLWIGRSGRKE